MDSHARRPRPSITVENRTLQAAQRRMALGTIVIPSLATVAALALAPVTGVTALDLGLLVGMYVLTNVGIEVGFHRHFAHRAFETTQAVRVALAILGSMAAEGSVLYWAAGHRRHHAHSDTGGDPHSPHVRDLDGRGVPWAERVRGLWHAHVGWMMTDKVTNCTLFASDILRDPVLNRIHRLYVPIALAGLAIPALVGGVVSGSWTGAGTGFLWGGLVRMFLVHHSTWSNASFGHVYGRRPFPAGDRSATNAWCALPTLGASWQNNHHMFPTSAYLGLEWWQVDVGRYIIQGLAAVGLAWNVSGPPSAAQIDAARVA